MNEVTSTEAANGLSRLLDAALQGRSTLITRHGRPVARLEPASLADRTRHITETVQVLPASEAESDADAAA